MAKENLNRMREIRLKPLKLNLEGKLTDTRGIRVEIIRLWKTTIIPKDYFFSHKLNGQMLFKEISKNRYPVPVSEAGNRIDAVLNYYALPQNIKRILKEGANAYLLSSSGSSEYKPIQFFEVE